MSSNQATFSELNQDLANGYMDKLDKAKVALIRVNQPLGFVENAKKRFEQDFNFVKQKIAEKPGSSQGGRRSISKGHFSVVQNKARHDSSPKLKRKASKLTRTQTMFKRENIML